MMRKHKKMNEKKTKTVFNFISADWKRIKNHCRTTVGKEFTEIDPSEDFKKKLLIFLKRPYQHLRKNVRI